MRPIVPDRHGGRLSEHNAALGCRKHHRDYDHGRLHLHHTTDGRPILRPDPPDNGPSP